MALFNKTELNNRAQQIINFSQKSAPNILEKFVTNAAADSEYDIFLSHRYLDAKYILGLKTELEDLKYSVFIDWIEKPALDRASVQSSTANWLRKTMSRCRCLLYAISDNSTDSKWMPWELGYSDGLHGKVAIVPIVDSPTGDENYLGQEYLGIYPYITKTRIKTLNATPNYEIFVNKDPDTYVTLRRWLNGGVPVPQ